MLCKHSIEKLLTGRQKTDKNKLANNKLYLNCVVCLIINVCKLPYKITAC